LELSLLFFLAIALTPKEWYPEEEILCFKTLNFPKLEETNDFSGIEWFLKQKGLPVVFFTWTAHRSIILFQRIQK
jgi:hypothetical protein